MMFTIDKIVEKYKLTRLDWIKIDVEGSEVSVLKGSRATLTHLKPKLLIENHCLFVSDVDKVIRDILLPLGYKEENISGQGNNNWSKWEVFS